MARTSRIALIAATLTVLLLLALPAAAQVEEPQSVEPVVAAEQEAWRGDVPIKAVIGGTAVLLVVLSVVAVRREWV